MFQRFFASLLSVSESTHVYKSLILLVNTRTDGCSNTGRLPPDRYISDLTKSPSSSTEATNTSIGTSSIHPTPSRSGLDDSARGFSSLSTTTSLYSKAQLPQIPQSSKNTTGNGLRTRRRRHNRVRASHPQVQLQICHDPKANVLYVTVLKAKFPKQESEDGTDHDQVDPYVVVNLLPDRALENQRRTRHVMSLTPFWNQTMGKVS